MGANARTMPPAAVRQSKKRPRPSKGDKDKPGNSDQDSLRSASKTKQLIRGVERLLRREGLAADLRAAQEAKLAKLQRQLEHQQEDAKTKELEIKMSLKYKKAKFFERKKITRTLAKLAKRLAKDGPSE